MISSINLHKLRNAEYIQFGKDALKLITDANATTLGIAKQATAFQVSIDAIDKAFKTEQGNPISQQLMLLDAQRDNLFNGIWKITDGYLLHFTDDIVAKAELLKKNLLTYGKNTTKLSYPAETANINSLITDWELKPDLTAAASALHLTEWKDQLKTINTAFANAYSLRAKTEGDATNVGILKELRLPSVKLWDRLTTTLAAQYYLHEEDTTLAPKYVLLINSLNALINTYQTIVTIRQAKNQKAADTNSNSTITPTSGQ